MVAGNYPVRCGAIGSDRIGDRIVGRDAKNVNETRVSMREGVDAIDNGRWGGIRRTWCCSLACAEGGKRTREEADVSGARDLAGVKKPRRIGRGDALARAREANPPRGDEGTTLDRPKKRCARGRRKTHLVRVEELPAPHELVHDEVVLRIFVREAGVEVEGNVDGGLGRRRAHFEGCRCGGCGGGCVCDYVVDGCEG